ncbi:ankyrin repeat domain-containing protein [Bacillus cereus]|uniref:ankyrin repeat domain-containing protein n=1 Tax=Bacillus cereus TaxID=1396 RepID=UPI003980E989
MFEAIKNKNLDQFIEAIPKANIDEQDQFGRTPLHYVIIKKAPIEMFERLLAAGAKTTIKDRLHESVFSKAIKFGNKQAVECLIKNEVELNHPAGIKKTPWFAARHNPEIADLLLGTKGAVRLRLTESEQEIIDCCLYGEGVEVESYFTELNTPVLLHAFVLHFNWDDELQPMKMVL